jgi:hypothetical protein
MVEKNEYAGVGPAEIASGITGGGAVAGIATLAYGRAEFGDTALARAREEIPRKLKEGEEWAAKLLQELKAKHPPKTEAEFIQDFLNDGYSKKGAELMGRGEYTRYIAQEEADAVKFMESHKNSLEAELDAGMKRLETDATRWKDASWLGKPLLAFKAAPVSVKVGVIGSAAALGLGVAWAVNRWRNSAREKTFTERLESEQATPSIHLL